MLWFVRVRHNFWPSFLQNLARAMWYNVHAFELLQQSHIVYTKKRSKRVPITKNLLNFCYKSYNAHLLLNSWNSFNIFISFPVSS